MTGHFSFPDPARCQHYARFMSHLTPSQANAVYFSLFALVLMLLYVSSGLHHSSTTLQSTAPDPTLTHQAAITQRFFIRRRRKLYVALVLMCSLLSIGCVVLQALAALNLEYCYGEDLMMFYWSFWSVLQVGSVIAQLGVALHMMIVHYNLRSPSWGVALGTPVLVLAAVGYVWDVLFRKMLRKAREHDEEKGDSATEVPESGFVSRSISKAPSVSNMMRMSPSALSLSVTLNEKLSPGQPIIVKVATRNGEFEAEARLVESSQP